MLPGDGKGLTDRQAGIVSAPTTKMKLGVWVFVFARNGSWLRDVAYRPDRNDSVVRHSERSREIWQAIVRIFTFETRFLHYMMRRITPVEMTGGCSLVEMTVGRCHSERSEAQSRDLLKKSIAKRCQIQKGDSSES